VQISSLFGSNFAAIQQAVQPLLGHSKLESTVRYLGIEVDDALVMAEQTVVWQLRT